MTRKRIIIISVIALVLAGVSIALLLTDKSFFSPRSATPDNNQNANTVLPEVNKGALPIMPLVTLKPAEQNAVTVARNFAERYGSFSTDSQGLNIEEVKLISTAKMQTVLEQDKALLNKSVGFYGVSSKALKTEIKNLDEAGGAAEVIVSLQRSERKDGAADFVYNQDLNLSLIKAGENWLVDGAQWQE